MFKEKSYVSTGIAIVIAMAGAIPVNAMDDAPIVVKRAPSASEKIVEIVDATNGDFNQNGARDLVVLARTPGSIWDGEIIIFEDHFENDAENMFRLRGYLTVGRGVGEVKSTSETSFSVTHGNLDGRNSWSEALHLAYRNGEYILAGRTIWSHDGFDEEQAFYCDLNLLTGEFLVAEGQDVAGAKFTAGHRLPLVVPIDMLPSYLAKTANQGLAICSD